MAGHSRLLNDLWAEQRFSAKMAAAFKRDFGEYAPVGEGWTKQTRAACVFPTKGMIAHSLLRWRKADGSFVPWDLGREGDTLMAPAWKLNGTPTERPKK